MTRKQKNAIPLVKQYNSGICDKCGGELRQSVYVGGDHDPIVECSACDKHFGCWVCEGH